MKKTLLTVLIGSGLAVSALAQGTVNFENEVIGEFLQLIYAPQTPDPSVSLHGSSAADTPSGTQTYNGGLLAGTRYIAELWYGPSSATDASGFTAAAGSQTPFQTAGNAGKFNTVFDVPIPGANPGTSVNLQVRVWDTTTGSSYNTALSKGASEIYGSGQLGGATGASVFFTPDPENWTSFNIVSAVPEPSTFALAGLGAAALLIFRRRK